MATRKTARKTTRTSTRSSRPRRHGAPASNRGLRQSPLGATLKCGGKDFDAPLPRELLKLFQGV